MTEDWHAYNLWPWQKVKLIDGLEQRGGLVMRRKANSISEYRAPTPKETLEEWDSWQW